MYRTHTCGCLRACNVNQTVTLAGWVQKVRNLGAMTFIDLRDRYGITQIVVEEHSPADVKAVAGGLGREYVLQVEGRVVERSSKNPKMPTGDIEVVASKLVVLHEAEVPPFTNEEHSDGGATGVGSYVDVYVQKDGVTDRLCGAYVIDTSEDSGATREGKIEWVTLAADPEDVKELLGASGKGTVSLPIPATARGKKSGGDE